MYVLIELLIFTVWLVFLFRERAGRGSYIIPLFVGLVSAFALEAVNDFVFSGVGAFYPNSLFYFPFTGFPVAIVLAGSLYAVFFHFISVKIFSYLQLEKPFLKYLIFMILLLLSIPFEFCGQISGYWKLHETVDPDHYITYLSSVYLFYFAVTLPCFITAEIIKSRNY